MPAELLNCSYANACSGCDWLLKPCDEQRALKLENLRAIWQRTGVRLALPHSLGFRKTSVGSSRDRVDLMFDRRDGRAKLGLFDRFRTGIVDLQGCPQLSPTLEAWLRDFRRFDFPIQRGSIRLRVAPNGQRGVWLDFANVDIKTLLDERTLLDRVLASGAIVEIGQKRKRLVERDGRLKLDDAVLFPWFETYVGDRPIPLYTTIGNFTQPGFATNRVLVDEVAKTVSAASRGRSHDGLRAAEFGSGIGNFTVPLATLFSHVDVYEIDTLALEGLTRTLDEQALTEKVTIHAGNYQGDKAKTLDVSKIDLLFVDPPRSGLMKFLAPFETGASRPSSILYVSCFAESFAQDSDRLAGLGYRLERLTIVDQFPQSRHYETVALFTL